MTNADLWKQYDEYTKALTANCEKLGFAAAAIAWFFKTSAGTFPTAILFAFGFIIFFSPPTFCSMFLRLCSFASGHAIRKRQSGKPIKPSKANMRSQHGLIIRLSSCGGSKSCLSWLPMFVSASKFFPCGIGLTRR